MTAPPLVLSLFPGIGLLDRAFEEVGCVVVRGPDLLWGGDVRTFHVPAGKFDGVIGGPPCKAHSALANISRAKGNDVSPDLIPEFERIVAEAAPAWWLSENVPQSPVVNVPGYVTRAGVVNNLDVGGFQRRERLFCFGTPDGRPLAIPLQLRNEPTFPTISAQGTKFMRGGRLVNGNISVEDACEAQGLPRDFFGEIERALRLHGTDVLTKRGKLLVVGNGVPLPLGRSIAQAVGLAMGFAP